MIIVIVHKPCSLPVNRTGLPRASLSTHEGDQTSSYLCFPTCMRVRVLAAFNVLPLMLQRPLQALAPRLQIAELVIALRQLALQLMQLKLQGALLLIVAGDITGACAKGCFLRLKVRSTCRTPMRWACSAEPAATSVRGSGMCMCACMQTHTAAPAQTGHH